MKQVCRFIDMDNVFIWKLLHGGVYAPIIGAQTQPRGSRVWDHSRSMGGIPAQDGPLPEPFLQARLLKTGLDVRTLYALLKEHYYLGKSSKRIV